MMKYFYHVTDENSIFSIFEFGLVPNKSKTASTRRDSAIRSKVVFVTDDFDIAMEYALKGLRYHIEHPAILRFLYDEERVIEDDWYESEYYIRHKIKKPFDIFIWGYPDNPSKFGKWTALTENIAHDIKYGYWSMDMTDLREIFLREDVAVDIMYIQLFAWIKREIEKRHLSQIVSYKTVNSKTTASQYIHLWQRHRHQEPIQHDPISIRISNHKGVVKRDAHTISILVGDDAFDYPDIDKVKEQIVEWMQSCKRYQRWRG